MSRTPSAPDSAVLLQATKLCAQAQELRRQGRLQEAVHAFQAAARACPALALPYEGLLEMLLARNDLANAATVLAATPPALYRQSATLQGLHGGLLLRQEKFAEARRIFEGLLGNAGLDAAKLHFNLGWCHVGLDDLPRALAAFRLAAQAGMPGAAPFSAQSFVLQRMGDIAGAEALLDVALQRFPDNSDLLHEKSIMLLRHGHYARGFALFGHRLKAFAADIGGVELPPLPRWDGTTRVDALLVTGEQGIGDQIVYSALLPALATHARKIGVCFDPRLNALLARSFPGIDCIDRSGRSLAAVCRGFDAYVLAGDVGATTVANVGWKAGCLQADPQRVVALREKYATRFPGRKLVGISWKSPKAKTGADKSIALDAWRDVLATANCQFVSLQYGEAAADIAAVRAQLGVDIHLDPDIDGMASLDALAAQIAALDQVITISNTTAHVAAALGTPTWVMLPVNSGLFWYWGVDGASTPWYPAARLFRARREKTWDDVLARVAHALRETTS
ncbi:MAG: hypothetical protein K0R03_430 [Moraxellaceae bacterium]|jgi:tetratricopeptide (TPR) repeat protein|nr:hypothetical protein [Moraxellaceae bacterium]